MTYRNCQIAQVDTDGSWTIIFPNGKKRWPFYSVREAMDEIDRMERGGK